MTKDEVRQRLEELLKDSGYVRLEIVSINGRTQGWCVDDDEKGFLLYETSYHARRN